MFFYRHLKALRGSLYLQPSSVIRIGIILFRNAPRELLICALAVKAEECSRCRVEGDGRATWKHPTSWSLRL